MQALQKECLEQNCNMILYGDNATFLAIKTISNTSKGRGIGLANELSLEYQDNEILHVKPIRDILSKEVAYFCEYRSLSTFLHSSITTGMDKKASINRMTLDFIVGLENDFPSTVSTVTRTAYKIPSLAPIAAKKCIICRG